jgi:ribonuclease P/MRP protein subunit POP1
MLIQRSVENPNSDSQAIHGWTLVVPAGWSMPFFSSLTFTSTRVGGQRERQTQSFEAGVSYFPRDYPSSTGYDLYAAKREEEEKARWERMPPAKRPNFEKLGTRSPWTADWKVILGLKETTQAEGDAEGDEFVTTQREAAMDVEEDAIKPWLLRGIEVPKIISSISRLFNYEAGLLEEMNRLRLKRGQEAVAMSFKPEDLLKAGLVSVRIKVSKRGAPEDLALLYSIKDDEAKKWEKVIQQHKGSKATFIGDETPEESEVRNSFSFPECISEGAFSCPT